MNKKMLRSKASALWSSSLDLNSNENITFCFAMRFRFNFVSTVFLIQQEMPVYAAMFVNIKLSCVSVGGVNLFTISKVDKTMKKDCTHEIDYTGNIPLLNFLNPALTIVKARQDRVNNTVVNNDTENHLNCEES